MIDDLNPVLANPALFVISILAFFSWYIAFVMFTTRPKVTAKDSNV